MGIFQKHKIFTIERCQICEHARMYCGTIRMGGTVFYATIASSK